MSNAKTQKTYPNNYIINNKSPNLEKENNVKKKQNKGPFGSLKIVDFTSLNIV